MKLRYWSYDFCTIVALVLGVGGIINHVNRRFSRRVGTKDAKEEEREERKRRLLVV